MSISEKWRKFKCNHPERLKLLSGLIIVSCSILLTNIIQMRLLKYNNSSVEINYVRSLVSDLNKDIKEINSIKVKRNIRENRLDSLIDLLDQKDFIKNRRRIYELVQATDDYESFFRTDRTMQELKYTGNIHLLKNVITDGLISYDNYIIGELDWNNKTESDRIDYYKKSRFSFFDVNSIKMLYDKKIDNLSRESFLTDSLAFQPYTVSSLNQIRGTLFQLRQISHTCQESGDSAILIITNLIKQINDSYTIH